jgi:hypothetical protein
VAGGQWFLEECSVEQQLQDGTLFLTVRHKDGAFRRFEVVADGRGLVPADGAQEAISEMVDGRLTVRVGDDRYRFPATIKGDDSAGNGGPA